MPSARRGAARPARYSPECQTRPPRPSPDASTPIRAHRMSSVSTSSHHALDVSPKSAPRHAFRPRAASTVRKGDDVRPPYLSSQTPRLAHQRARPTPSGSPYLSSDLLTRPCALGTRPHFDKASHTLMCAIFTRDRRARSEGGLQQRYEHEERGQGLIPTECEAFLPAAHGWAPQFWTA
jgi:hypothetical protein